MQHEGFVCLGTGKKCLRYGKKTPRERKGGRIPGPESALGVLRQGGRGGKGKARSMLASERKGRGREEDFCAKTQ